MIMPNHQFIPLLANNMQLTNQFQLSQATANVFYMPVKFNIDCHCRRQNCGPRWQKLIPLDSRPSSSCSAPSRPRTA